MDQVKRFLLVMGIFGVATACFPTAIGAALNRDTPVRYKAIVTPGAPDFYSEIPAAVTFTDQAKELETPVKITLPDGQGSGARMDLTIAVRSKNGYKLKKDQREGLTYGLIKEDGEILQENTTNQPLCTLPLKDAEILTKAKLMETAEKTGKYTDTLCYSFSISTRTSPTKE